MPYRILVAIEFCETNDNVADYAFEMARPQDSSVTFIHVTPDLQQIVSGYDTSALALSTINLDSMEDDARKRLAGIVGEAAKRHRGVELRYDLVIERGDPAERIVGYAWKHGYDVIVLGHRNKNILESIFLGSTAERVVKTASCTVTLYRHREKKD